MDKSYYLARAALVKDERGLDKFDRASGQHFKLIDGPEKERPAGRDEWLQKRGEKFLSVGDKEDRRGVAAGRNSWQRRGNISMIRRAGWI